MNTRPSLPLPAERAVLIKSRRRCCLCFWLEGIDEVQRGQIAHLDHDRTNMDEDNLCFLCTKEHHDDYDTKRSQSKGLKKGEVKQWRDDLYKEMAIRFYALEVERKLRIIKQEIRKLAHEGLVLRTQPDHSIGQVKEWIAEAAALVKQLAGDPAEFDFVHCFECVRRLNLDSHAGRSQYINIHASHLKELAQSMDATDLIE